MWPKGSKALTAARMKQFTSYGRTPVHNSTVRSITTPSQTTKNVPQPTLTNDQEWTPAQPHRRLGMTPAHPHRQVILGNVVASPEVLG